MTTHRTCSVYLDVVAKIYRLSWACESTYDRLKVRYITQKYGSASVVFDGYTEAPTKIWCSHETQRDHTSLTVHFTCDLILQYRKDDFLKNPANERHFLHLLSNKLFRAGCQIGPAFLITQTDIASPRHQFTVLVGDDTELIMLLLHHIEINWFVHGIITEAVFAETQAKNQPSK